MRYGWTDLSGKRTLMAARIEFGLFLCDTTGHATIKVGSAADIAPYLLGRILSRLPDDPVQMDPARQVPPSDFEQRFLPLAPVLTMLNETIELRAG